MTSHSKKRKLDEAIPEAQEAPATRFPKPRKGLASKVIVIEDDPPLDGIQESQGTTEENGESVREIGVIVENLRDQLLQEVDFHNMAHLRALSALDDPTTPRDCVMFCDTQSFALFQVDYILRTGTTATYIWGGRASIMQRDKVRSDGELKGLRVLSLTYEPENPNGRRKFEKWERKNAPPKSVYDVGQLFVQRRGQGRQELLGTQYNLTLDITKPRKPVWLVMRPEYAPVLFKKPTCSDKPFSKVDGGLNGVAIAKLANSFAELDFCGSSFNGKSHAMFSKAENLIASTGFKGELALRFSSPNFGHMEEKVTAGWSGTQV
ncbi:hypothetical protein DL764_009512 [Monosporascus ibericus]|uniref:Uncharacterized protein n=1 Tax=Monosporascus ibericus TaxID=155417 RepID=A0A4Q4SXK3_9PEZI|nr:hypothetical protein DL764_009512 [Monosporascus ibericus]